MLEDQGQWAKYYHGSMPEKRYARAFSYSDRARYYLTNSKVQGALRLLLDNLNTAGSICQSNTPESMWVYCLPRLKTS